MTANINHMYIFCFYLFIYFLFLLCRFFFICFFFFFWLTRLTLVLQKSRMTEDKHEAKFIKKRELLNLEKILSNSEPVIARDSNGLMPFLPPNRNDIEMTYSGQEQDPIKIKNKGHRTSIAKAIDYVSRFLFPFAFISFNIFYWYHFLNAV